MELAWPPRVGDPLPRGELAYAEPQKLAWILSAEGHGREWARVLHIGPQDTPVFWEAIIETLAGAQIVRVTDRAPFGIVCGIETVVRVGRCSAKARTSWHYTRAFDAPRLLTAYPRP